MHLIQKRTPLTTWLVQQIFTSAISEGWEIQDDLNLCVILRKKVRVMGNQFLLHYFKESCALSDSKKLKTYNYIES